MMSSYVFTNHKHILFVFMLMAIIGIIELSSRWIFLHSIHCNLHIVFRITLELLLIESLPEQEDKLYTNIFATRHIDLLVSNVFPIQQEKNVYIHTPMCNHKP